MRLLRQSHRPLNKPRRIKTLKNSKYCEQKNAKFCVMKLRDYAKKTKKMNTKKLPPLRRKRHRMILLKTSKSRRLQSSSKV